MPPGQAKKWQVGQVLPANLGYSVFSYRRAPPKGAVYVRNGSDVLLIAEATRRILEIVSD